MCVCRSVNLCVCVSVDLYAVCMVQLFEEKQNTVVEYSQYCFSVNKPFKHVGGVQMHNYVPNSAI